MNDNKNKQIHRNGKLFISIDSLGIIDISILSLHRYDQEFRKDELLITSLCKECLRAAGSSGVKAGVGVGVDLITFPSSV
jgi:hypothetical protein